MNGRLAATKGPRGEEENASPMQWVSMDAPRRSAVKYNAHPPDTWTTSGAQVAPPVAQWGSCGSASDTGPQRPGVPDRTGTLRKVVPSLV